MNDNSADIVYRWCQTKYFKIETINWIKTIKLYIYKFINITWFHNKYKKGINLNKEQEELKNNQTELLQLKKAQLEEFLNP